jgi:hypothetical protein
MVNTAFTLAVLPIAMVYMPFLFNVLLGAAPSQAAVAQAATWGGIILGSAAATHALRKRRPESLAAAGLLALGAHTLVTVGLLAARAALGTAGMSAACTAANAVAGAAGAFVIVPLYSLFHARTVEEFRGRFWGVEGALRTAAMCAGYFLAGALVQLVPLAAVFAATGVVLALAGAVVLRVRALPAHSDQRQNGGLAGEAAVLRSGKKACAGE